MVQNPHFWTNSNITFLVIPFLPIKSPQYNVGYFYLQLISCFKSPHFVGPCPCDIPLSLLGPLVTRMAPANNSGTPASAGSSCQSQDQDPQLAMDQVSLVSISNNEVFIQHSFNIQNCFFISDNSNNIEIACITGCGLHWFCGFRTHAQISI